MKGLTGIAALEAEMRDRLADRDRQIERLQKEVEELKQLLYIARGGELL